MSKTKSVQDIQAKLREELEGMAQTVAPPSGFNITLKGKVFTLPNGSTSNGPLECVVLDWISENVYYSGVYNPKKLVQPDCFALGKIVEELSPSKQIKQPQNKTCDGCIRNEWDSSPTGGGKACKNTRKLLVTPKDAADDNAPVYIVTISPTGLKHFDKYVRSLEKYGKHPIEMVTHITFDQNEAYPSLRFKNEGEHGNLEVMWALREQNQGLLTQERNLDEQEAA